MRSHDELEQERETRVERAGYTPDSIEPRSEGDGPLGDGVHGRYCVVAVYPSGEKVLSRWATSTMAAKIAEKVSTYASAAAWPLFIGVKDEHDPEAGWLAKMGENT